MKHIIIFITLLFVYDASSAQDVKFRNKLISFNKARIAFGLGLEMSDGDLLGYTGSPSNANVEFEYFYDTTKAAYFNYSIDIDLYSPYSLIGIWTSLGYTKNRFYVKGKNNNYDIFDYDKAEIPVYLKLRTGRRNGNAHAWIAAGMSYNIIISCERNYDSVTSEFGSSYTYSSEKDEEKGQLNNSLSMGGLLGYEIVNLKKNNGYDNTGSARLLLFARFNYYFQSVTNQKYRPFNTEYESAIADYSNFSMNHFAVSFGLKFFFTIPKAVPK